MQSQSITPEFFIQPGVDLQAGHAEYIVLAKIPKEQLQQRWQETQGRNILTRWKANRFDRETIELLVGKFYGHLDLRGIDLSREDLSGVDLSSVDLYGANLECAVLQNANLSESYLSETNIKGTNFNWSKMDNVLIDGADFNNKTSFTGVKLQNVDFNLAGTLQDFAIGQQRIAALERRYPRVTAILRVTCDYGRSFPRFFAWCGGVVLFFGVAYWLIPGALSHPGWWNSFYFSVMTFANAGSDIQPVLNIARVLVLLETIAGYLMTGLLVAILVKRTIGD